MKSQYQWLKEEQARQAKQGKGSWQDDLGKLAVLGTGGPMGSQYLGNTGYGEDGRLQPSMPTGVVQTAQGPVMLHEGETAIRNSDGTVTIIPAQPTQSQLLQVQQRTGMPGMQTGGTLDLPNINDKSVLRGTGGQGMGAMFQGGTQSGAGLVVPDVSKTALQGTGGRGMAGMQAAGQTGSELLRPNVPGTTNLRGTGGQGMGGSLQSVLPAGQTLTYPNVIDKNLLRGTGGQGMAGLLQEEIVPGAGKGGQGMGGLLGTASQSGAASVTPPPAPAIPPTQFGGGYWGRGMQRLERYAEGRGPYDEQIYNQSMGQFKGEEAAARGALEQQMAQGGITGREAATERYMAGLGIGAQETQLMADLRKEQADRAFEAAKGIPSEARAQEQMGLEREKLDFLKQQYGDEAFQRMSADIAAGMTPEQAAQKYGLGADQYNQVKASVLWSRTMEEKRFGLEEGQYNLLVRQYGDLAPQRIATMVQNGMTAAQIRAAGYNISDPDWAAMRSTLLGEQMTKQMNAAEEDLAGYFQANYTVPGYNWRTDPGAASKLQRAWEAGGRTGQFTEAWADQQFNAATQTTGARFTAMVTQDPNGWFAKLPDVTVRDATGKVTQWGKDEMLPAVQALSGMLTLGGAVFGQDANGRAILVDPVTGAPIGGGGAAAGGGIPAAPVTYNATDPVSVNAAISAFTVGDGTTTAPGALLDGVTSSAMTQWLSTHGGIPPASEEAWTTWSNTQRTFDPQNRDDVGAALYTMKDNDTILNSGVMPTFDMVKVWLAQNGGKIGDLNAFIEWAPTHTGSVSGVTTFFAGTNKTISQPDATLANRILKAEYLMSQKTTLGDGFEAAYKAAGFTSLAEVETTAGMVSLPVGASMAPTVTKKIGTGTYEGTLGDPVDAGVRQHAAASRQEGYPHAAIVPASTPLTAYAAQNAGKVITIDGTQYYVNPTEPLTYASITVPGGTVIAQGLTVYDPETMDWKVYLPYTAEGQAYPEGFLKQISTGPGLYDVDRDRVENEGFAAGY